MSLSRRWNREPFDEGGEGTEAEQTEIAALEAELQGLVSAQEALGDEEGEEGREEGWLLIKRYYTITVGERKRLRISSRVRLDVAARSS